MVRDRSGVRTLSLRHPEALPPAEIRAAMLEIVRDNLGATRDQIFTNVSRALGFKSTKGLLRGTIQPVIERALAEKELVENNGVLTTGPAAEPRLYTPVGNSQLEALVAGGENDQLELKQTLRWDVVENQVNKKLEDVAIKTVAAFANATGGMLLIGVRDDGTPMGLDPDLQCLGGNCDRMELHLTNLFSKYFGQSFRASRLRISFPVLAGMQICKIEVKPASEPMFVTIADRGGAVAERFFVRSGNSSHELTASQTQRFIKDRF